MPLPHPAPVSPFPDALAPCEPLVAIAVQPPSPPFSGRWGDSTVIYNGERILDYEAVKPALFAAHNARAADKDARLDAVISAWKAARAEVKTPTDEELAAHTNALQAFAAEQRELDRESYRIAARYLVWRVTDKPDGKGLTYLGGPDQLGWDTAPLPILMWLTLKGQSKALEELTGPLPGS